MSIETRPGKGRSNSLPRLFLSESLIGWTVSKNVPCPFILHTQAEQGEIYNHPGTAAAGPVKQMQGNRGMG